MCNIRFGLNIEMDGLNLIRVILKSVSIWGIASAGIKYGRSGSLYTCHEWDKI